MERRSFLKSDRRVDRGLAGLAARRASREASAQDGRGGARSRCDQGRSGEPGGVTRVWLPLPLRVDTDYYKRLGDNWKGNAAMARTFRDKKYDAAFSTPSGRRPSSAPVVDVSAASRRATAPSI